MPGQYLKQCWLLINSISRTNLQWKNYQFSLIKLYLHLHTELTHCGLVMAYGNTEGVNISSYNGLTLRAPNHNLNQCWFLISEALWHSFESNFTASAQATILYTCIEFQNYISKIAATSSRGQWVNGSDSFRISTKHVISTWRNGRKGKKIILSCQNNPNLQFKWCVYV